MAVLLALLCACAFLGPALSPANSLLPYPPELLQPQQAEYLHQGGAMGAIQRGNLDMGDKFNQSLAWDQISADRLRQAELPLWTRRIGGGVPFIPQMAQPLHPMTLLLTVVPASGAYGIFWALHLLLLGYTAYLFLRRIGLLHGPALFGMVCLLLGLWTQARIHHNVMLSAVLPLFAMLGAIHQLCVHGGGRRSIAVLALGTGLSWLSGFAPASLLCTWLCFGFYLLLLRDLAPGQRLRVSFKVGGAVGLGFLLAAGQLLPVLLAAQESARTPATLELLRLKSLDSAHLLGLIWPTLLHSAETPMLGDGTLHHPSWPASALLQRVFIGGGFNFPETACYTGLACLCLVPAGRGQPWFKSLALVCLLGLAIALALPGVLELTALIPGAHSGDLKRYLLLVGICLPILGALGLQGLLLQGRRRSAEALTLLVAGLSLVGLLFHLQGEAELLRVWSRAIAAGQDQLGFVLDPQAVAARFTEQFSGFATWQRQHLIWVFAAGMVTALGTFALLRWPGRHLVWALCLLSGIELLLHGQGTRVAIPRARIDTPPQLLGPVVTAPATAQGFPPRLYAIQQRPEDQRTDVLAVPAMPNLPAFWGIEDLCAYNPLPKRRMEEFFDALGGGTVATGGVGVAPLWDPASLAHPLADLIGIEWILSDKALTHPRLEDASPPDHPGPARLYRRRGSLPRVTFVQRMECLPDPVARRSRLADPQHRPADLLILEDPGAPALAAPDPEAAAAIEVLEVGEEQIEIRCRNEAPGYLRLADPYDAGWTCDNRGAPTRIYRADHYLRAVYLPAGDHHLRFRFAAPRVTLPLYLSLAAACVALLLLVLPR